MSGMACGAGMSMNMNDEPSPTGSNDDGGIADNHCMMMSSGATTAAEDSPITEALTHKVSHSHLFHKTSAKTTTASGVPRTTTESTSATTVTGSIHNSHSNLSSRSSYQTHHPAYNHNISHTNTKPPRQHHSSSSSYHHSLNKSRSNDTSSLYKPSKQHAHGSSSQEFDHDYHTFATATTASATISYSTDEVDVDAIHSDVSEAGMEVVMDQEDDEAERAREEAILALLDHQPRRPVGSIPEQEEEEEPYTSHSFPAGKHTFTVDRRYSFLRVIGSGAYGVVISAKDAKSETDVAIKMVPRAFHDEIDAKRILREIKLLKHFHHENIVGILDMMPPSVHYVEDYHDVYMVTDLMETDLHRIIYSKQKLSLDHVQYFVYQVLRGLKYIHSCNVLHRDLKPSNLLVNSNCDLKICDFGLARGIYDESTDLKGGSLLLTEYVVTRWYRAPEIMLACHEYSKPIDVWSVGCIFAELLLRKPYFPGDDYIDQVRTRLVVCCCGVLVLYHVDRRV
jgi:tRNA A-37 threonylcarbamoyl transferase component Bud32